MKRLCCNLTILSVLSLVYSCNKNTDTRQVTEPVNSSVTIDPAFSNIKISPFNFVLQDVSKANVVKLINGSELEIPEGAFLYADGTPVKGEVSLEYREYRDAADIILSGLPMEYDSAGVSYQFQTAGMFDIYGFQNGNPVYVKDGKTLTLKMKSAVIESNYNFYQLDSAKGNWEYLGPCEMVYDKDLSGENKSGNDPDYPISPAVYNPDGHLIDLKIDVKDYPELASIKNLMWQYAGNNVKNDLTNNSLIYSEKWKEVQVVPIDAKESLFRLSLRNDIKSTSLLVKPVLAGKAFDKAMEEFQIKREQYERDKRVSREKNTSANIVTRVLGIQQFGIYNCDRIYSANSALLVDANIVTNDKEFDKNDDAIVYLVTGGSRTSYKLKKSQLSNLRFVPEDDNALVAILPGNRVALFSNQDFKKLNLNQLKETRKHQFILKTMADEVVTADQLRKIIGS